MIQWIKKIFNSSPLSFIHEYRFQGQIGDGTGRQFKTDDENESILLREGFHTRKDGIVVCISCGGNCGQCGTSKGSGQPASMQALVDRLHGQSNSGPKYIWEPCRCPSCIKIKSLR